MAVYDNHDAMRREIARQLRTDRKPTTASPRIAGHCRFIKACDALSRSDPTSLQSHV